MQQSSYYLRPPGFAVTREGSLLLAMGRDMDNLGGGGGGNPNEGKDMEVTVQTKQLQSTLTTFRIL